MGGWADILIRDYTPDPVDEGAFAINLEVQWPGTSVSYIRLSFEEKFIEKMFHVRWNEDLAAQDERLSHERRDLFIRWGLVRLERWMEKNEDTSKLMLTFTGDGDWAKQVMNGTLKPKSETVDARHYRYWLSRYDETQKKSL